MEQEEGDKEEEAYEGKEVGEMNRSSSSNSAQPVKAAAPVCGVPHVTFTHDLLIPTSQLPQICFDRSEDDQRL